MLLSTWITTSSYQESQLLAIRNSDPPIAGTPASAAAKKSWLFAAIFDNMQNKLGKRKKAF